MRKKRVRIFDSAFFQCVMKLVHRGLLSFLFITSFYTAGQAQCDVDFDLDITSCDTVLLTNKSVPNEIKTKYSINWGDGKTSSISGKLDTITHFYKIRKSYKVILKIENKPKSCDKKDSLVITLPPVPNFEFDSTHVCLGESYAFPLIPDSSAGLGGIDTVWINYGDGSPLDTASSLDGFTHTYAAPGTYKCTTFTRQSLGPTKKKKDCVDRYHPEPIIYVHEKPKAHFLGPDTICQGQRACFDDRSKADSIIFQDSITLYSWDFGDGTSVTAKHGDTCHVYSKPGTYTVVLSIESTKGECGDIFKKDIVVCPKPKVSFTFNEPCEYDTAKFVNTSTDSSCCGIITYYDWDFGDGSASKRVYSKRGEAHKYDNAGTYQVTLSAYIKDKGLTIDTSFNVKIAEQPTPFFSYENTCENEDVLFLDSTQMTIDSLESVAWLFGDGSKLDTHYMDTLSYRYPKHGTYSITAISKTNRGCIDTFFGNIKIHPAPQVVFSAPNTCLNQPLAIDDKTSIHSSSSVLETVYSFGDGQSTKKANPSHFYNLSGTYKVKLVTESIRGCLDSLEKTISVHPLPSVAFSNDTVACAGDKIDFINKSTATTTVKWKWYFDGQDSSADKSPSYAFKAKGNKVVTLQAENSFGCIADTSDSLTIIGGANPNFFMSADTGCTPLDVSFTLADTSIYDKFEWEVEGVLASSTSKLSTQTFEANGGAEEQYSIKLKVTNLCGFKSQSKVVTVIPKPIARFTPFGSNVSCTPSKFTFENNSIGLADSFIWSFGGADTVVRTNVGAKVDRVFTYKKSSPNFKKFTVKLLAKNVCDEDEVDYDLTVFSKDVNALFELVDSNDLYGCVPHTVELKDNSVNSKAALFDMGDKTKITVSTLGDTIEHTYQSAGNYIVRQMVSGCGQDTVAQNDTIIVYALPKAEILNLPDRYCSGSPLTLDAYGSDLTKSWLIDTLSDFSTATIYPISNPTVTLKTINRNTTKYYIKLLVSKHEKTGPVCGNEVIDSILIVPEPLPKLSTISVEGCHPLSVFVTNTSSVYNDWLWELKKYDRKNDTLISEAQSSLSDTFQYTLANKTQVADRYRLILTIDNNTCKDTISTQIDVFPLPESKFAFELLDSNVKNCNSKSTMGVKFTNQSTGATQYSWNFEAGATSIDPNPEYTFKLDKSKLEEKFNVVLRAINKYKCETRYNDTVTILSQPQIDIDTTRRNVCEGDRSLLTFNTIESKAIYEWRFPNMAPIQGDTVYPLFKPQKKSGSVVSESFGVQLHVAFTNGCKDSLTITDFIRLYHRSQPDFWFTPKDTLDDDCYPDGVKTVVFNASKTLNGDDYHWDFGDGGTETIQNPEHTFRLDKTVIHDSFRVRLFTENKINCADTLTQYIQVLENPKVQYPKKLIEVCEDSLLLLAPVTIQAQASYTWTIENGIMAVGDTVWKKMTILNRDNTNRSESYDLKLLAEFPNGCKDSLSREDLISVYYLPEAHFWFTPKDTLDDDCYPEGKKEIVFNADSSINSRSFSWSFGNGKTSIDKNPTETFKLPKVVIHDSFLVELIAENKLGCPDTVNHYVEVKENPVVKFPKKLIKRCDGDSALFQPLVIQTKATYSWHFGNGTQRTGDSIYQKFPVHVKRKGVELEKYTLKLLSQYPNGCKDSVVLDSIIHIYYRPEAHFWFSPIDTFEDDCYPDVGKKVAFSSDSSKHSKSYIWNFGNGKASEDPNPQSTFRLQKNVIHDSFYVSVIVENGLGCSDTFAQYIDVRERPDLRFPKKPIELCENDSLDFSPIIIQQPATYYWFFGDGTTYVGDTIPKHFPIVQRRDSVELENYSLKLLAVSTNGCKDSLQFDSLVSVFYLPETHFWFTHIDTLDDDCYPEGRKRMYYNSDSSTNVVGYHWDFGNGTTKTVANPKNEFKLPLKTIEDSFLVNMVGANKLGCKDSASAYVHVKADPVVKLSTKAIALCANDSHCFTPLQIQKVATYKWRFGDGVVDTGDVFCRPFPVLLKDRKKEKTETHLTFIASLPNGCSDSMVLSALIKTYHLPLPSATFKPAIDFKDNCYPNGRKKMLFNASDSSINSEKVLWDMGDGTVYTSKNPTHTFTLPTGVIHDSFQVRLIGYNALSCTDTAVYYVSIKADPKVLIGEKRRRYCEDDTLCLQALSIEPQAKYLWRFSDGLQLKGDSVCRALPFRSNDITLQKEFTAVKMIAEFPNGCKDSIFQDSLIVNFQLPVADFQFTHIDTLDDDCYPRGIKRMAFKAQSSINAKSLLWDFGDGSPKDTGLTPLHTFQLPMAVYLDSYQVSLVAFNKQGCTDTLQRIVSVKRSPTIDFRNRQIHICEGDTFCLEPKTIENGAKYSWEFTDGQTIFKTAICKKATIQSAEPSIGTELMGATLKARFPATGCADSASVENLIKTYQLPLGVFGLAKADTLDDECYPDGRKKMLFDAGSSLNTEKLKWYFGDGDTARGRYATHIYQLDTGIIKKQYTVSLVAKNAIGCPDSTVNFHTVLRSPHVLFDTINRGRICENIDTCFKPSKWYNNAIYQWTASSIADTSTYWGRRFCTNFFLNDTSGTIGKRSFDVKLMVELPNGCRDSLSAEELFTVYQLPKVKFNYSVLNPTPDSCYDDGRVTITFNSGASKNVGAIQWNFGDGTKSTMEDPNPQHTYQLGTDTVEHVYVVSLEIENRLKCATDLSDSILVKARPFVDFTGDNTDLCEEDELCLKPVPKAVTRHVKDYTWLFRDGTKGSEKNYCRPFSIQKPVGSRDVTLQITLNNQCIDSLHKPNYVNIRKKPTANFYTQDVERNPYTKNVLHGKVKFIDSSTYLAPDTALLTPAEWNMGDETSTRWNVHTFTHVYTKNGSYDVQYMITDTNQCSDTIIKPVTPKFFYGLNVPDALIPERGLGESKVFKPKGLGLKTYTLQILDPTGKVLFYTDALDECGAPIDAWDGTYRGALVPQGPYLWTIVAQFENGEMWKGNFNDEKGRNTGILTVIR